jgi:hypothetical protein
MENFIEPFGRAINVALTHTTVMEEVVVNSFVHNVEMHDAS